MSPLVCPDCHGELLLDFGRATCGCGQVWTTHDGFRHFYRDAEVRGPDRFMRLFYNGLPALHDPLTKHLLPRLQRGGSEAEMREAYMQQVDIGSVAVAEDGQPCRVLEVGIGAGGSVSYVRRDCPAGVDIEYWGLDLSVGMLRQCRRKLARQGHRVNMVLGDAHALPFGDDQFDRVFHVGAIGNYGDPAKALAEMARVAKPGTPIVVVDEALDDTVRNRLHHRLAFRLLTFYDRDPHCPVEHLPPGASGVEVSAISRFYYCLRFQVNEGVAGRP